MVGFVGIDIQHKGGGGLSIQPLGGSIVEHWGETVWILTILVSKIYCTSLKIFILFVLSSICFLIDDGTLL